MFSHILIPTDGSALSLKAARVAAGLALDLKAKVTALYVFPPYLPPYAGEGFFFKNAFSKNEYTIEMRKQAEKILASVEAIVAKQRVRCASESMVYQAPWEGIIKGASKMKCDLIVMGSHGRGGLAGIVLGSQTTRVLTHSKIPVLVCR
jgi:nucleotide-binding universal stress UspA family protein